MAKRMIIKKHTIRQYNLSDIAKMWSWCAISEALKLFEQTMYTCKEKTIIFLILSYLVALTRGML
jgi:hypothetical protein